MPKSKSSLITAPQDFEACRSEIRKKYLARQDCPGEIVVFKREPAGSKVAKSSGRKNPTRTTKAASEIMTHLRAENFLHRQIYRYAQIVERNGLTETLREYVTSRDGRAKYRPRNVSSADWVVRLVNMGPLQKRRLGPDKGKHFRMMLFDPGATQSRLIRELKFAAKHNIHWHYFDLFIYAVGGPDVIAKIDETDAMSKQKWVRKLTTTAARNQVVAPK